MCMSVQKPQPLTWLAWRCRQETGLVGPFTGGARVVARQDFWLHPAVRRRSRRHASDPAGAARCVDTSYQGSISCDHALMRSRMQAVWTLTQLAPVMAARLAANIRGGRGPISGRSEGSRAEPAPRPGPQAAAQRIEQDRGSQCGRGVRDRGREAEYLGCQQEQCRANRADHNRTCRVVQSPSKHFAPPLCAFSVLAQFEAREQALRDRYENEARLPARCGCGGTQPRLRLAPIRHGDPGWLRGWPAACVPTPGRSAQSTTRAGH